jgi:hypothetical protein
MLAFAKKFKLISYNILLQVLPSTSHAAKSKGNYPEGSLVILPGLSWNNNNNGIMNWFNTKN